MRILLVTALVGGGVGAHVRQLATGLIGRGHTVRIACPTQVARAFALGETGADVIPLELGARPRPGADLAHRRRLRAAMHDVDVVHAHGMRAGAASALARHRGGPALVVTSHNAPPSGAAALVYELLERVVARRADLVLGVSPDLVERAAQRGARAVGEAVVPAPGVVVATEHDRARSEAALRAELGLESEGPLVLTAGRLAPQKRVDAVIAAFHRVVEQRGSEAAPVLVVAGDGPEGPRLRALAAGGPGEVRWLGHRHDVPELLRGTDLVVSAAVWEGQPLVLQEALAAGAAIVATDVGGTGRVLGGAGVLVPADDRDDDDVVSALATQIAALLHDPDRRAALRVGARERAAYLPTEQDALEDALAHYAALIPADR